MSCEEQMYALIGLIQTAKAADEEQRNRIGLGELHRARAEAFDEVLGWIKVAGWDVEDSSTAQ
jgi:hypothetical protein